MAWFGPDGNGVDWHFGGLSLICLFGAVPPAKEAPAKKKAAASRHVLVMLHGESEPREFFIPDELRSLNWRTFIDTASPSPRDIYPKLDGPKLPRLKIEMLGRSLMCFVAEPSWRKPLTEELPAAKKKAAEMPGTSS